MMRLRVISLRRASLYLSPPAIRVPAEPFSHDSRGHKTRPDTFHDRGTVLNHEESKRAQKLVDDRPNIKPNFNKQQALNNHRPTGFSVVNIENLESSEELKSHDEFTSDVERIYRILRKFHSRVPKLELALQQSGVIMRSGLTQRVLNRCGDAGNLAYRFFVWASKQPGYRRSSDIYKAMVESLGKMRQFGTVWALLEEMRTHNPQMITPEIFIVLMRRFASARMVKNAIQVFDEMPKYGCEADEYVFGCLLDALCKNGSVKEAALLFEEMSIKFEPNLKHLTSLLYGWCREGKLAEAKFVLVKMREAGFEPDIVVYNNLLGGYAQAGKMTDAYELLKEMRTKKDCSPNATSYTILIQALCKHDKTEEAMRVFSEMTRNGCDADGVTYTTLIGGLCKWGKIEKAYETLNEMVRRGFTPDGSTYLPVMLAHEKREEFEECLEVMTRMRETGCRPKLSHYNTAIRLACKLGEVDVGVRLWDEMEAAGLSPGTDTFVVMIHGLVGDEQRHAEVCERLKEMVGRGLFSAPNYGTLKEVLNKVLRGPGGVEMAKEVWGSVVASGGANAAVWTIWVQAMFSRGHVKEACACCFEMMDAGEMPQPDTFARLMRGLRKLYNRAIAAVITEKVRDMAAQRGITFKMYKRRGERDLKHKVKQKTQGRLARARRRRWSHRGDRGSAKSL